MSDIFDLGFDKTLNRNRQVPQSPTAYDTFQPAQPQNMKLAGIAVGVANSIMIFDGRRGLSLGNLNFDSAPFRVNMQGDVTISSATLTGGITATSGSIGGFTIGATTITATNLTLTSGAANTANITVGTGANAGGLNSAAASGDIIFWGGATYVNRATAPFNVTAAGLVTCSNITITGGSAGPLTIAGSILVSTGGNIRSGQTAYNTGTGWFLEYNAGTPRFSIGNSTSNYLIWDGSTLSVLGNLKLNSLIISTTYETAARFSDTGVAGGVTYGGNYGVKLITTAAGSNYAFNQWVLPKTNDMTTSFSTISGLITLDTAGSDFKLFFGVGSPGVSGADMTYLPNHRGFKITRASSGTMSLKATQADGVTETASAALATIAAGDDLDLIVVINGSTSTDYLYRQNSGAKSAITNLSTNNGVGFTYIGNAITNVGVAANSGFTNEGSSFIR